MIEPVSTKQSVLSEEGKRQFKDVGFLVLRQFLSAQEVAEIQAAFMRVLEGAARESGWDGTRRLAVVPFIDHDEHLIDVFSSDRINDVVDGLLGPDGIYHGADGNFYVGNTRWHPDASLYGYPTIKIALYLDSVGANSGALSIIPGSHHRDYGEALHRMFGSGLYDVNSPDIPGRYALVSEPGDLVVFNHAVWHSSWGGKVGRRMYTMNYDADPVGPSQNYWLRGLISSVVQHPGHRLYSDRLVDRAGPRAKAKLAKPIEWGYQAETLKPVPLDSYLLQGRR
jgi:ectoine hydroxylase-related dioxygenase (phytanoyl-CoA dioxygenase family)